MRGAAEGGEVEREKVIHKTSGRHNQGNTNMEIVCTPADIIPRLALTVANPTGSLPEHQGK